jgi:flagellar motor switch protein FliM
MTEIDDPDLDEPIGDPEGLDGPIGRPDISDDEVEALLEKADSGQLPPADEGKGVAKPYDLVAPDKIVRGRMPALDRINERWVGEFQRKLEELLRQPVEVSVPEVQLGPYGEWLARLPEPSSLNLYMIGPWRRNALVSVDGTLLFVLVDAYYGGGGRKAAKARTELTVTEQRFNALMIEQLTSHFRNAFAPIAEIQFDYQKTEINPHYVSVATSSETVVVTRIEVSLNDAGGSMCLVFPLSTLDPVRDKLTEGLKTVSADSRQRWGEAFRTHLERTELDLSSVFLESELSMRDLLRLKPGDILPIEMPKTATLYAGSRPLLQAKFGLSRGYNAVSVIGAVRDGRDRELEEGKA